MKAGSIEFGGRAVACLIRHQSETGAALEVVSSIGIPAQFTLLVAADRIKVGCIQIWRMEKLIGVKFHLEERPLRGLACARAVPLRRAHQGAGETGINQLNLSERPSASAGFKELPLGAHRSVVAMPGSPSIVPQDADHDMYIILDAFGAWVGRAWGETEDIYRETVIRDLLDGVYSYPVRIVAFNTAEGWSRNITFEIAAELKQRRAEGKDIPACVQNLLALRPTLSAAPPGQPAAQPTQIIPKSR